MLIPRGDAHAKPLIADLSRHIIEIDSSFRGTQLILFGARQSAGDVMVVVRGPARDYTLRKKERVGGIWINRYTTQLFDTPDYYAIAATKPLELLIAPALAQALGLGLSHLNLPDRMKDDEDTAASGAIVSPIKREFNDAYIAFQQTRGVYRTSNDDIAFMGDTLFKTTINFPDTIPRGIYTAETYLFNNGRLISVQSTPLVVRKSGFDAVVYDMAHQHPTLYGMIAVILAVSAGWLASAAFRRL